MTLVIRLETPAHHRADVDKPAGFYSACKSHARPCPRTLWRRMKTKLKLGTLVDEKPGVVTIEVPAAAYRDLVSYAEIILLRQSGQPLEDRLEADRFDGPTLHNNRSRICTRSSVKIVAIGNTTQPLYGMHRQSGATGRHKVSPLVAINRERPRSCHHLP